MSTVQISDIINLQSSRRPTVSQHSHFVANLHFRFVSDREGAVLRHLRRAFKEHLRGGPPSVLTSRGLADRAEIIVDLETSSEGLG